MKKNLNIFVLFLLTSTIMLASCTSAAKTTQTTNSHPLATTTEQGTNVADQIRETATPRESVPEPDDIGYYDGIVTITQYYTFLGHGLYEEAFQLLSANARRHSPDLEGFVEDGKRWFKEVEIITIQPYHVYVKEQGGKLRSSDSMTKRRFYVQIIAWGDGKMSGSRLSGEVQTLFIRLVKEDREWKIDEFGTAPLF